MSYYMMCWKFSCEQNFDSVPFSLPKPSTFFPNRHRFTAGTLPCQETPSLRYKYTYHGLETGKELVQAEIIAVKESYRHGQKKHLGAILELAHHLVLQNEWNIKIIFSEQKYKKLREVHCNFQGVIITPLVGLI